MISENRIKSLIESKGFLYFDLELIGLSSLAQGLAYCDDHYPGLSPHTRGKRLSKILLTFIFRSIPAYVGETHLAIEFEINSQVYPRIRGETHFEVCTVIPGRVVPALETMLAEHRLRLRDFEGICNQSSIVPPQRSRAFAKALFSGYELDFDSAIHRLVPQIENMVRYHLKAAGAVTTVLDKEGIEAEVNLGTLLDKPEALLVFGEDLVFEMQAMFCESRGPNFRHHLAHGLLEDKDFETAFSVYAWCLALRLVFNVFWNSQRKE